MKIHKIINNNFVSSFDEKQREVIVSGRGIGFGRKNGDEIPDQSIQKIYQLKSSELTERFKELLAAIPLEYVQLSDEIITYAKEKYRMKLSKNIYISLTDHINYSIQRFREGIKLENALLWDIRRFYNMEYLVGKYAVALINERYQIDMGDDEAGFIALHFVNAEYETGFSSVMEISDMMKEITKIIHKELDIPLDEDTLHYERFLAHLKFMLQRVYKKEFLGPEDAEIVEMVRTKCAKEYECSKHIISYIKDKTEIELTGSEIIYLALHIRRIQKSENEETI